MNGLGSIGTAIAKGTRFKVDSQQASWLLRTVLQAIALGAAKKPKRLLISYLFGSQVFWLKSSLTPYLLLTHCKT
jgi:hypothetical protein